jgi:hypothetical protein
VFNDRASARSLQPWLAMPRTLALPLGLAAVGTLALGVRSSIASE